MDYSINRRSFLTQAGGLIAFGPMVFSRSAFGREVQPSNRITMGVIGCGGMGNSNTRSFLNKPEVQVLAVCDPDRDRRLSTKEAVEEHYASQTASGTFSGCDDYNDFRDLIARDDIDAVIVASPDHWHSLHVIMAAQAGKDVYGEKPLSLTIAEGRAMSDAIARYARVFQTGSQQRSDGRFRLACEIVRNGLLGPIRRINVTLPPGATTGNHPEQPVPEGFDYDLWLGPSPFEPYCEYRTHYNFRYQFDYSGGKIADWGAHHIDIVQWALGTTTTGPVSIEGRGEFPEDGLWDTAVRYDVKATYASGVEMRIRSHGADGGNGVEFIGDDGRLFVNRGRIEAESTEVLEAGFAPNATRLYRSTNHHQNFLDCMRSRRETVAPIEHAHRSISIAHLGNIAMRTGRAIRWDPDQEVILSDATASRLLGRAMRAPWRL